MRTRLQHIGSVRDLREYVYSTFCERYQLELGAFQMTEKTLLRGGKPCGLYFCLYGPRMMRFTAIWETTGNRILFYGAQGERFQRTQLAETPRLEHSSS